MTSRQRNKYLLMYFRLPQVLTVASSMQSALCYHFAFKYPQQLPSLIIGWSLHTEITQILLSLALFSVSLFIAFARR